MSPEWIDKWKRVSQVGDIVISALGSEYSEGSGYCDPRDDDFYSGADLLDEAIEEAARLLPDGWPSLQVLAKFEGIRDHLERLGAWMEDNTPGTVAAAAAA